MHLLMLFIDAPLSITEMHYLKFYLLSTLSPSNK